MKHMIRERVMREVRQHLDAPLPKPRDPRRMRVLWVLVGFAAGALAVLAFLIIPGAFL